MKTKIYCLQIVVLLFLLVRCVSPEKETNNRDSIHEEITIDQIGYDNYGKDCSGGIYIHVKDASIDKDKIGETPFIKPSDNKFVLPDGLIASGGNKLKFFGEFKSEQCIHLMGDGENPEPELFFVYDSIHITCPYKYFNIEAMEFDSQTCGRHESFHEKIKVVE